MKNTITIISIVKSQDHDNAIEIFSKVIEKYCDSPVDEVLKIGTPKQIPNQFMFVIEVPKENSITVVKELTHEGISVVKNEMFIKIAVNEAMNELQSEQSNTIQRLKKEESLKQKLRKRADYTIEELALLKDWQLLLEISLWQSHDNIEKSREIKELLPDVLNEAIESEINHDTKSYEIAKGCVERLMLIAENDTLKRFHYLSVMRKSGEAIIEMCRLHPEKLIVELIFLANSRTTIPFINIKAFIAFYEVVNLDAKKYENEILEAARYLNTRALDTIYLASVKLSQDEKKIFNKGVEYFKEIRKTL